MIERGLDDYTVMSMSGHSPTRMLERSRQAGKRGRARSRSLSSLRDTFLKLKQELEAYAVARAGDIDHDTYEEA